MDRFARTPPSAPGPSAPGPSAPGPSAPGPSAPGPSAPGAVANDDQAEDTQRPRSRDSLFLIGRLTLPGSAKQHDVRIRNLSTGGLMAEIDRPVAIGAAVALEMRGIGDVTGIVAWCAEGRIGVALDQPIDPRLARKQVGSGATTPVFARPVSR